MLTTCFIEPAAVNCNNKPKSFYARVVYSLITLFYYEQLSHLR